MGKKTVDALDSVIGKSFHGKPDTNDSDVSVEDIYSFSKKIAGKAGVKGWASNVPGIPMLAARVVSMIPVVDVAISYFKAVGQSIHYSGEIASRQGYVFGYALTMMYLSTGRKVDHIYYVEFLSSGGENVYDKPGPDFTPPDNAAGRNFYEKLVGFYQGKEDAIKIMGFLNQQKATLSHGQFYDLIIKDAAERVDLKEQHIDYKSASIYNKVDNVLRYYSKDD